MPGFQDTTDLQTLRTVAISGVLALILGLIALLFPNISDQHSVRTRFGKAFRFIVSQRLLPKKDGQGRIAAIEILKSTLRTRDYVEKGESEGKTLLDAMRDGDTDGMQHFDGELEKLLRAGIIDFDTALGYSTNPGNFRLEVADFLEGNRNAKTDAATSEVEVER